MKKEQLYNIKNFIDEIFRRTNLTFIEVSNSLLHVHRYQSDFLLRYTDSFVKKNNVVEKAKKTQSRISLSTQRNSFSSRNRISDRLFFDILIVSHFVAKRKDQPYSDFYFSQIINTLSKEGYRIKVIYIDGADEATLNSCNKENDQIFYDTVSKKLPVHLVFLFLGGIFIQSLVYRIVSLFITELEKKKFYRTIARMESSWTNLCTSYNVGKIVKEERPRFLVTTFEGQAYERLIYFFSRKSHKKIIRIGYFHAAIFEHQFSVKQSMGVKYDPDLILTQGNFASRILGNSYNTGLTSIKTIGSPRAINYNYNSDKENVILVIPSGILTEVIYLLIFSKKLAEILPGFKVYFRFHPSFDLRLLEPDFSIKELPVNFFISNASLEADATKCKFTLFRDSTAIFNAVALGSLPVYIRKEGEEILVNPIYGINEILPDITTPIEFKNKLEFLSSLDPGIFQKGIQDIVSEFNESNLIDAINNFSSK